MKEKEVLIHSVVNISATLTVPTDSAVKTPAVLIIPGTGKIDRNGRVNAKIDLKLYKQLAEGLTALGFYTLRYDKRGVGKSEGNYFRTGLWDLVEDAKAGILFLKSLPEIDGDKVIVLGHSEGCILGTALAARENLGGLILLSGAVERITEALERQRELARLDILKGKGFQASLLRLLGVPSKIEKQAQKYIRKVLESEKDTMRIGFVPTNTKWMREHFVYNVRNDLSNVQCPVLAITGERDIQANPAVLKDLPLYVKGDAEYYVVENMGHSCKFNKNTSNIFSLKKDIIADASLPLHPELVFIIEKWLKNRYMDGLDQKSFMSEDLGEKA